MTHGLSLALDGSTYAGSVAVIRDTAVVASAQLADAAVPGRGGREEKFLPMVAACLDEAGVRAADLDRVICGAGPGSFTSLRVAASIAKGIAVGAGRPLFAVSSLLLIVAGSAPGRYLATMDAMRGELYAGLFHVHDDGSVEELRAPSIITQSAAGECADAAGAVLAGIAAARAAHVVPYPAEAPLTPAQDHLPHARRAAAVIGSVIAAGACSVDTWEPDYGRLAEAQVRWEAAHGRPLTAGG